MKINWEKLSQLDTASFTVEDVMAIHNMWRWTAKLILKTAVRQGKFGTDGKTYWLIDRESQI